MMRSVMEWSEARKKWIFSMAPVMEVPSLLAVVAGELAAEELAELPEEAYAEELAETTIRPDGEELEVAWEVEENTRLLLAGARRVPKDSYEAVDVDDFLFLEAQEEQENAAPWWERNL
jgi:hypothetical protein